MVKLHGKTLDEWTLKKLINHARQHKVTYSRLRKAQLFKKLCDLEKGRVSPNFFKLNDHEFFFFERGSPKRPKVSPKRPKVSPKRPKVSPKRGTCGSDKRMSPKRKSPPYSAKHCAGQRRKGVDGSWWISKRYLRKGEPYYRWARA